MYVAMLLTSCVFAQSNTPVTMTGTGTMTNTGTVNITQTVVGIYDRVSLQVVVTKYSGTVGGTCILQGSIDGTNYKDVNTDTLTLANQTTNTKIWVLEGSPFYYYRIQCIGTGTMSAQAKGYFFGAGQGGSKHSVNTMLSDISATSDTTTNTGTGYVQLQVKGTYENVAIQATVDKISGTVAGTVTLQGSNDGTNFVTLDNSYSADYTTSAPYTTGGATTLSCSNVTTNSKIFLITGSPYSYYRLSYTGSGTMSARLRGYLMPNKK